MSAFNWNDLRFFLNLVRAGNPARAAKLLGVDHTTVRRRIAALEEDLKVTLFEKHDDVYGLTPQGEKLLRSSEAIESLLVNATSEITGADEALSGTVRIGAPDGLGSYYLAPRLTALRQQHPDLQVELVAKSRQFNLSKREADIAIVISRPAHGRHIIRKLIDCSLYLFASSTYLARYKPIETLQDLKSHSFIGYTDQFDFSPELDPTSPIYEELSQPAFASTNLVAQFHATLAGGGICLLPYYMVHGEASLRPVLKDQFKVVREIWLLVHHDLHDMARYRAVTGFILEQIMQERHLFS
jgi:DNA-binding transcriptional LysR family regulator